MPVAFDEPKPIVLPVIVIQLPVAVVQAEIRDMVARRQAEEWARENMQIVKKELEGATGDAEKFKRVLNKLVPPDQVLASAVEMARQIASHKPAVVQGLKQLLGEQVGRAWPDMLASERAFRETVPPPPPPTEAFKDFLARTGRNRS